MIISGKARGNGKQLGSYFLAMGENESVRTLHVTGANQNVKFALLNMSLQAEKTKGSKGVYHAHIAPDYGEDKLTDQQWLEAVDDLEQELGFAGQNRVVVWHEKRGKNGELKAHIHCAWQLEKDGRLLSTSHNYKKHDAVRGRQEKELGHRRTIQPKDVKKQLGAIWEQSTSGADFVAKARAKGYEIGKGYTTAKGNERGYTVQTPEGQKLNLVRQLPKEVKERDLEKALKSIKHTLPDESELEGRERVTDRQNKKQYRAANDYVNETPGDYVNTENKNIAGERKKEGVKTQEAVNDNQSQNEVKDDKQQAAVNDNQPPEPAKSVDREERFKAKTDMMAENMDDIELKEQPPADVQEPAAQQNIKVNFEGIVAKEMTLTERIKARAKENAQDFGKAPGKELSHEDNDLELEL